jgi:uncharacterized repeat protein (TIGR02543 family)
MLPKNAGFGLFCRCQSGGNVGKIAIMRRQILVLGMVWLAFLQTALATSQLIVDGSFSATSYSPWWVVGGSQGGSGVQFEPGYVTMGNWNGASQWVYQTVVLPTNLIGATLSLGNATYSTDPNGDDTLAIYMTDTALDPLLQIGTTLTSANPNDGFAYGSTNFITYAGSNILSTYAGQTVNLLFYVVTDPSYGFDTSFDIDDVSLVVGTTADIPANDNFTNAAIISGTGITNDDVVTTYASRENAEPFIDGNRGGRSVWWSWTAPAIGTVIINTAGSQFNTLLGVYTGTALSNLVVVTNSNGHSLPSETANVKFTVTAGTQYYITLDGYDGQSGIADFVMSFSTDTTPPTVAITSPKNGADVTSPTVLVQGTAKDNVAVAAVYCQLVNANGSNAWQLATGTNTWSITLTNLIPGENTIRAEAIDTSSNISKIASSVVNYIITVPLTLTKIGEGTVSGATNGELLRLGYPYTLTATAAAGFAFAGWTGDITTNNRTIKFIMASNLDYTATFVDVEKPTLSITEPVARERWSNSVFNVTGKAKDNVAVAAVWYQVNTEAWANNVSTGNGWTNWNVSVTLQPGTNTIKAYAVDGAGNISITNSVSFVYVLSDTLTVLTNGHGTLKPNYNNALLEISNGYAMTATASAGYVFSNWTTSSGAVITTNPALKFIMASNLSYTANFVPNPFTAVAGTYAGLFYDTNLPAPISSGYFTALVNDNGSFTAKFQQGGKTYSPSGQFSLTGGWNTAAMKTWDDTAVALQLDLTGGSGLEGNLTNSGWTAELSASREVYSTSHPAPEEGLYTLILPTNSASVADGNGFGTVNVNSSGTVTFGGTLGDGTKVTDSAVVSGAGQWPLYISLDSGKGMLLGWLTFTNEADSDISGQLSWFKPAQSGAVYPAGFTNEVGAIGSAYSLPKGARVLNLTNGYVHLQDGGLPQAISDPFTLGANNVVAGSDKLSVTITTTTGLFKGAATNSLGATVSFTGAVFQKQTNGFGQFLNANQTGSVYLAPQ